MCRLLNLQPCLLVSITITSGFSVQFALVALTQGRRAEIWIVIDCFSRLRIFPGSIRNSPLNRAAATEASMYLGACSEAQCQCIADNPSTCLELRRVFGPPACGSVCSLSCQINERHRAHLPLTAPDRQVANARSITPGVKSRQTPRIAVTRDQEIRVNVWWFRGAHDDLACDNPSDLSRRVFGTRPPCPCLRDEGLRIAKCSRPHGSPKSRSGKKLSRVSRL